MQRRFTANSYEKRHAAQSEEIKAKLIYKDSDKFENRGMGKKIKHKSKSTLFIKNLRVYVL